VGFLQLPSWHMVVIVDSAKVGELGLSSVYAVKKTVTLRICHETFDVSVTNGEAKDTSAVNEKFLELLSNKSIDSSWFYSHNFDLTRNIQSQLAATNFQSIPSASDGKDSGVRYETITYPSISSFDDTFVWNKHLMDAFHERLPNRGFWLTPLIHGVFLQRSVLLDKSQAPETRPDLAMVTPTPATASSAELQESPLRKPVSEGGVEASDASSNAIAAKPALIMTLIARRSRHYAGTRFMRRGINHHGWVANEVETEQILIHDSRLTSAVIYRGSIPFFWTQRPSPLKLAVPVELLPDPDGKALPAGRLHFQRLLQNYGGQIHVLNLVKQKVSGGGEHLLEQEYKELVTRKLAAFSECKDAITYTAYDLLNKKDEGENVINTISGLVIDNVNSGGVFSCTFDPAANLNNEASSNSRSELKVGACEPYAATTTLSRQRGLVRINCVDNLDRTNLGQFCVSKILLEMQLQAIAMPITYAASQNPESAANKISSTLASKEFFLEALTVLAELFTIHGDEIAVQYAGSGAMHKEVLSASVLSLKNNVAQAANAEAALAAPSNAPAPVVPVEEPSALSGHLDNLGSFVVRHYKNNFTDGERQYAHDVLLGHYVPSRSGRSIWELDPLATDGYQAQLRQGVLADNPSIKVGTDAARVEYCRAWPSQKEQSELKVKFSRRKSQDSSFFDQYLRDSEKNLRDFKINKVLATTFPDLLFVIKRSEDEKVLMLRARLVIKTGIRQVHFDSTRPVGVSWVNPSNRNLRTPLSLFERSGVWGVQVLASNRVAPKVLLGCLPFHPLSIVMDAQGLPRAEIEMWGVRYYVLQMFLKTVPTMVNSDVETVYILCKEVVPQPPDEDDNGSSISLPERTRFAILTIDPTQAKATTYALEYTYDIEI
jgi:hypothetical protein